MRPNPLDTAYWEDCPYDDITTELLGIEGSGRITFSSRVDAKISGTERLEQFLQQHHLQVEEYLPSGSTVSPSSQMLSATGNVKTLFKMWRIAQTFLTVLSAITSATDRFVRAARQENPGIEVIVACRKAHPGMRQEEIEAVQHGGALYHRNSLSDTILITQNHLRVLEEWPQSVKSFHHKVEVEPPTEEDAYRCAPFADIIILDHYPPDVLRRIADRLKAMKPELKIGVAGGISLQTVKEYASLVDIILTSSVLYAPPLDFTCKISRI